jgi:hypothetical protein
LLETPQLLNPLKLFLYQIISLSICLPSFQLSSFAQDLHFTPLKKSAQSCSDSQASVTSELRSKGFFIPYRVGQGSSRSRTIYPKLTLDDQQIQKYYYGYPQERTQALSINLSGDSTKLYVGLLSSPVYLSQLSARIMSSCPSIGLINFNHWWEGGVPVGFFPDGTARTFQYIEFRDKNHTARQGDVTQYEWGYYFSL